MRLPDRLPVRRIAVVKMDIEGAEREVFARNLEPWLSLTDAVAVEMARNAKRHFKRRFVAGASRYQRRAS